jgi:hypothetical protein
MVHEGALHVKPVLGQLRAMSSEPLFFRLRLPENLKAQIEASAKANGRSMNAEVLSRLERSFDLDDGLTELDEGFTDHEKRIDQLESQVQTLMERAGLADYDRD